MVMPKRRPHSAAETAAPVEDMPLGTALAAHAERAADCELELIRLFLAQEKHDIARRRLQQLGQDFPGTAAARTARQLLRTL